MRVLFVTPFYKPAYIYGGPIRSISTLCEQMILIGYDVEVYTTNANGINNLPIELGQTNLIKGVKVRYFKRDLPGYYFYSSDMKQAIVESIRKFDLVYIASSWGYPFLPASRYAFQYKKKYIVSPRASFKRVTWTYGKFLKKATYHLLFERAWINRASGIHYTSMLERDDSTWLKLRPREFIIPNPVDFEQFTDLPAIGRFRQKWNVDKRKKIILYMGRVEPAKGLDLLCKAFSVSKSKNPDICLVIAGPEEEGYEKRLRILNETLHQSNNVIFTGLLESDDRFEVLVDADLFITTSYSENFGMSVLEAMACGVPTITSERAGIAPWILEHDAGIVVPLEVDRISLEIENILQNDNLMKSYSAKGRQLVREAFSPQIIASQMAQEFSNILGC